MNSYEVLWLNPRLSKKNFRGHAASLFKVQPTYCFLLFFYSPTTAALFNSSRLVLPSDFWRHITNKKSKSIEFIRTSLTKPEAPENNFRTHAALLFKVQPTYSFLFLFYSPRTAYIVYIFIYLYFIIYILIHWLIYLSIYLSIDVCMYIYIYLFVYFSFISFLFIYLSIYLFILLSINLFINGTKCWNNLHLMIPKLFSKLWKQKDRVK